MFTRPIAFSSQDGLSVNAVRWILAGILVLTLLGSAATARAVNAPGRSQTRAAPITDLALTHASIAFAVAATARDCDHVELWNPDSGGTWRFGEPRPCGDRTSTGSGIWDVAVGSSRVLWVEYTGGNIREWTLKTATITRKRPRTLRFVARDVDASPPIVVGPGARDGIPYAVDRQVTFLGDNGAAIFRWTAPDRVVTLTAGPAPGASGARVAVLTEGGTLFLISQAGAVLRTQTYAPRSVAAIQLAGIGLVAQVGRGLFDNTFRLPRGARMLDYAQGRVLYRIGRTVYTWRVATGERARLLPRFPTTRTPVALDPHGLAWATGRTVHWKCAACIRFGT
jgi:hypothetical protein